jgi:ABC-2 type transport system permease protein
MRLAWVAAVLEREAADLLRRRLLLLSILAPPIIIVVGPVVLGKLVANRALPAGLAATLVAERPEWASLGPGDLVAAYSFQQFLLFFLMLPAFIPLSISTFSIIGEKQSRTLEAVLATPIRTAELLAGKAIAAAAPGIAGGLIAYLGFAGLVRALYGPALFSIVSAPDWLAATFLLGPAVALLSVVLGVLVSSRANDPRTAQQIGAVIVVPLVGAVIAQAAGRFLVDATGYGLAALAVLLVALGGLRAGSWLFAREAILTRWR